MKPLKIWNKEPMIIETDHIRIKTGNQLSQEIPCVMQMLDESHLDEVMNLQSTIIQRLSRKEMLQPFSWSFMQSHFSQKGFVLGIFVENKLVAFRNMYYPDGNDREWNLGLDLGLPQKEYKRTANFQMVCVHPLYRGNSLARKMNQQAIRIIKKQNRFDHLLATVSPFNYWNVGILLRSGFVIKALKKKYNDKLRYIVYQNLKVPPPSPPASDQTAGLTDFQKQEKILQKGYHGFRICEIPGEHTPIDEISDKYHIRKIPDRFEIHFSENPVEGIKKHG
jgi:hypothetical protein